MNEDFRPSDGEFARGAMMVFQSEKRKAESGKWPSVAPNLVDSGGAMEGGWRVTGPDRVGAGDSLRATSKPIRRAALGLVLSWLGVFAVAQVEAQVSVTRSWNMGTNGVISDRGQYVSAMAVADAGLASISAVSTTVNLSSVDNSRPMVLGHYVGTLTHGTASENERMAYVFNRPNSTASSLNATYNFTDDFDGGWLASNTWSLMVADQVKGAGAAKLDSWSLRVTGQAQAGATVDLGSNGEVEVNTPGTTSVGTQYNVGAGETATLRPAAGAVMDFSAGGGGVSGAGTVGQEGGGGWCWGVRTTLRGRIR